MTYPLGALHDMQMITDHFTEGRIMTDDEMRERYSKRPTRTPAVEAENRRLHAGPPPTYYTTPPDFKNCMNYQEHGPTPCWHPHCNCFKTDPWESTRSEIIPPMIGLALVLGGLLAAALFLR